MTDLKFTVEYGQYNITFSTLPDRTAYNVYMTGERGSVITNRTIEAGTQQRKGMDFYLAGIEVFAKQAIAEALRQAGESKPTT